MTGSGCPTATSTRRSSPSATWWSRFETGPPGRVFSFNGTTEWALDDVEEHEAVWPPRRDQLLDLLGTRFLSLSARSGGHVVRVQVGQREKEHVDVEAADAAARALLGLLESGHQR